MTRIAAPIALTALPLLLGLGTLLPQASQAAATGPADDGAALFAEPFAPCRLTDALQLRSLEAECATVSVPEQPGPGGRRIELAVARIAAISSRPAEDPLVLLAGGPGQGAQLTFTAAFPVFARAARERDILLIDQRGTGNSQPLNCELPAQSSSDVMTTDTAAFVALSRRCLDELSGRVDPGAYTTSHAVRDLESVRALLGYPQLNLYAGSYGTRVAQHYARRHPDRVRSMVLDGVVAPETVLGPRLSLDAQAALDGIWQRCSADAACSAAFGDVGSKTRALQDSLRALPQTVPVLAAATGKTEPLHFGTEQLAVVLRLASYDAGMAAMLPLMVSEASAGNFGPLASLFQRVAAGLPQSMALGMHNSVVCSEDVPRFASAQIDRGAVAATYLGTSFLDALPSICSSWPAGLVDPDFHEPLVSAVPTLLLSGSLDPATPPADAEQVRQRLSRARHIVIEGAGHGQLGLPCMDRVLAEFFAKADPQVLDAACLDQRLQPPFWVSLAGPTP
jgi:pimeloyl-ACP methyl ester carboxylesterase